jgi:hypothetical protein
MITTGLLYMLYGLVWIVLTPIRVLDNATLPAGITSAISTASGYFGILDDFFPMAILFSILGTILTIEGGVMLYKLTMWVVRKIPGVG